MTAETEAARIVLGSLPILPRTEREEVLARLERDHFTDHRHAELFEAWRARHRAGPGPVGVADLDVDDDLRALAHELH